MLALLAVAAGCSTKATISRVNGPSIDAEITRGDARSIYVRTASGSEKAIARDEVVDIDHPGDTATGFGVALTVYGALNIAVGAPRCEKEGQAFCTGVFAPALVGVPMLIWGLTTHGASKSAASADQVPPLRAGVVPLLPVGGGTTTGAAFALAF